ncbi:MAG: formylglycine-generating enzyme family protein, partial [Treponema sp.]|nr:formylglycine-generating enzyme family protein [Treponema sp.]
NPSYFNGENAYDNKEITATPKFNRDKLPVEMVRWYEVLVFANKLSMRRGLQPVYKIKGETDPAKWGAVPTDANDAAWNAVEEIEGANGWRLPTEQQWEYAAKGGVKSAGYKGDTIDTYYVYSGSDTIGEVAVYRGNSGRRTNEVGKKKANALGLYDMSGNVWEWCFDKWTPASAFRVTRGGSWINDAAAVSSIYRVSRAPNGRDIVIGFRLVRS